MTADSEDHPPAVGPRHGIGHRGLTRVGPSPEDIERARRLPADACPRRYCWWWHKLSFTWQASVVDGCTFPRDKKPDWWPQPDRPCCRSVPDSPADHYESRGLMLKDDGVDGTAWWEQKRRHDDAAGSVNPEG